jgi:hypothetical protein
MYNVFKTSNDIFYNQIRIKLLYETTHNYKSFKCININLDLFKLKSLNSLSFLESFFFIEFFSNLKSYISYSKKSFSEYYIQLACNLRKKNLYNFLYLLNLFYLPIIIKQDLFFSNNFDKAQNYVISMKH